jgi:hypothetical protein
MPKLYEYFGLVFLMFSNEHSPIHVHVRYGDTESVIELVILNGEVMDIVFRKLSNKRLLPPAQQREAEIFVRAKAMDIVKKWNDYFVLHKRVTSERSTEIDFHGFLTAPGQNPMATQFLDITRFRDFAIDGHADIVWGDWEMCFPFASLYAGDIGVDSLGRKKRVSRKPVQLKKARAKTIR